MGMEHLVVQQIEREQSLSILQRLRREARHEISRLIQFLDESDEYVMTEREDDGEREEVGDNEPSLGSFDRMVNQEKSYRQGGLLQTPEPDAERDDRDAEDDDPAEESDPSGIGDPDGLLEQVGTQDWQQGATL